MAKDTKTRPEEVILPAIDRPHAPFIFYENAPAFGFTNGVINLTLGAMTTTIGTDNKVTNEQVVVAYLRGNVQAVMSLRNAIDQALLLAAPTPSKEGKAN